MWKVGCATTLVGLLFAVGSFFFFGKAVQSASSAREVASFPLKVGLATEAGDILIDDEGRVQIRIAAKVQLSEAVLAKADSSGTIESVTTHVSYEARDKSGEIVFHESGSATGSIIVPAITSPHRGSFDPVVTCSFEGSRFEAENAGMLRVRAQLEAVDDNGSAVVGGRLTVHDQIPESTSRWVWGGALSIFLGPFVMLVGTILFVIGILVSGSKPKRGTLPPVPRAR